MNRIAIDEATAQIRGERKEISRIQKGIAATKAQDKNADGQIRSAWYQMEMARMWLGKAIAMINPASNPYPQSMNPNSKVIEKTADTFEGEVSMKGYNEVGAVKKLRADIEGICKAIQNDGTLFPDMRWYQSAIETAWVYACNAKLSLGKALEAFGPTQAVAPEPKEVDEAPKAEKSKEVSGDKKAPDAEQAKAVKSAAPKKEKSKKKGS